VTETKRVRLSPQARRAQLIELGVELLATRPLDELSVELIAQTAGVSRGLLFHYFASKQEFHVEVARAAAAEMIRRTAPDPHLNPVEALRAGIGAFIDYVQEYPDNYRSLVRGAATGDAQMRAIFDETRDVMARRIVEVIAAMGVELDPRADLAVHGWVAYVEECVVRWLDTASVTRAQLLELLAKSLPAIVLATGDDDVRALAEVLVGDQAIGEGGPTGTPEPTGPREN
jgi:AcrR family transcriptional regulator